MFISWLNTLSTMAGSPLPDHLLPWPNWLQSICSSAGVLAALGCLMAAGCLYGMWRKRRHDQAIYRKVAQELEQAIALKDRAIAESKGTIVALRRQVDHLERMRKTGLWVAEQESALRELKSVLASSNAKEAAR